ncbi:MarR family winged helix-turn-helix transcriptional regulator [Kineococcus gynurae]|uniref:MarR family winged helix-turn-helix transcriptional regulator n=1 Tax=Kineococcus gynurae TaxID=452979 RepID=A0ABV5LWG7_9ACTN
MIGTTPLAPGSTSVPGTAAASPDDEGHGTQSPTDPLDHEALATDLRMALLRLARRLRAEKSDGELSDTQFSVLAQLYLHGPRTPGELAEAEHVRPPSMTRTVAGLTEAGLVTRTGSSEDRRRVLVDLTADGRRTVEETRRRRTVWLGRRLADLTPEELETLAASTAILRRMGER